ncbi:MAG: AAA family ATPase [Candidatus Scalindua sp.]|nr:AAA family ATPase [Candidatus Scalindua sp.]MBT6226869.1 AAA family ATPase [Candidatus Scalindua sp.]
MSFNIAVAGKGGSGKTSMASLVIRYLMKNRTGAILAVDADPNANLGESLGLDIGQTVGSIIASFNEEKINIPPGMTKEAYLNYKLNKAIIESKKLDLLTMGRGEGPECYCYPNLMLRKFIDTVTGSYAYMVLDNEAGMEHLSRRTTQNIDELLIISDHSVKGVRTVARIRDLVTELKLIVKRQSVIINFVPNKLDPFVSEELARLEIDSITTVPLDNEVYEYGLKLKPLLDLPDTSKAVRAVDDLMSKLLNGN